MWNRPSPLLALLLCSSCTFVGESKFQEYRAALDQDGDGSPFDLDCDDQDPARGHNIPEEAYNGTDEDCDGEDMVDRDGDGVALLTEAEWDALEHNPEDLTWTQGMAGGDCDDDPATGADIFPGAPDPPYDGIDSNCDDTNEFDLDGDGFTSADYSAEQIGTWSEGLQAGDCNDGLATVYPGAADEPYSGHDENCDGSNDYDVDGDGVTAQVLPGAYDAFCLLYPAGCVPANPSVPADCNDEDPLEYPGSGNPSLDCENDSDGDGFEDCAVTAPPCDCDDEDAAVNPAAPEVLDGIDEDCGGDGDQSPWIRTAFSWEGATPPAVAAGPTGWTVGVAGDWVGIGAGVPDHTLAIIFPDAFAASSEVGFAFGSVAGEGMDAVSSGDLTYVSGMSIGGMTTPICNLAEVDPALGSALSLALQAPPAAVDPALTVDSIVSGGVLSVLYCRGALLSIRQRSTAGDTFLPIAMAGEHCVWDNSGPEPLANVCSATGCTAITTTGAPAISRWPSLDVSSVRHRSGLYAFAKVSGGAVLESNTAVTPLFGTTPIRSIDAADIGAGLVAVAAVVDDGSPHVELLWGSPAGTLSSLELAPDPDGRVPISVGVDHRNGVIGVFAVFESTAPEDDQVAWVWLTL